ncbi:MAG: sulfatase-like hydrolase/transferase [Candidatus Eisenbacteria bacterium]|nr:sulfatase-like hydrolase/transferase [Candidatus Eisenbacteria bacterium]
MIRGRNTLTVILALAVLASWWGCAQGPQKPNAVLIILDTTRADALGCYGGKVAHTPRLDRLAAQGLRFERAVAHNPYTFGSIATILTSLGPDIHHIRANSGYVLADEAVTLAEQFAAAGYATAAFVSAEPVSRATGMDQGFDVYDDDFSMRYPIYDPQYGPLREEHQDAERRGGETSRRALNWLRNERPGDSPFFLMIHLFDPHKPYDPPLPFQSQYRAHPYYGEVAFCDSLVGGLIDALEELDLSEQTVVTVVGDHGEAFLEHGEVGHGFLLYETTLRVPWILAGPGITPGLVEGTAHLADVAPTLAAACGLAPDPAFRGENLRAGWPAGEDGGSPGEARRLQLGERATYFDTYFPRVTHNWSELIGWRRGNWKYVRGPRSELYDLSADPGEKNNLIEANPEMADTMSAELDRHLAATRPGALRASAASPDAERLEKLRSLGYVGGATGDRPEMERHGWELGLLDPKEAIGPWNRRQEAAALYRLSLVQFRNGDYRQALEWAEKSLAANPDHNEALWLKAKSLAALNRLSPARQSYLELVDREEGPARGWIGLGIVYDRLGQSDRAEQAFREAIAREPDSPEAHFNLGALKVRQGRLVEAAQAYERVRELEPDNVALRADLGRIYFSLEELDRAAAVLEEAYALDPESPGTLLILAQVRVAQGDSEKGRRLLEQFLRLHPDHSEAGRVRQYLETLEGGS